MPVVGTVIGGIIGGAAGLIGGLFGGGKKRKAQQALAQSASDYIDQLTVRALSAAGDDFAAAKKRLELEQKAEFDAAVKQFGANSDVVEKLRKVQAAETAKQAGESSDNTLAAGTYLAPAGFDANRYRFEAGRPLAPQATGQTPMNIDSVNIVVPQGTPREQAEQIVRELQAIAGSQGRSPDQWSRAVIQ